MQKFHPKMGEKKLIPFRVITEKKRTLQFHNYNSKRSTTKSKSATPFLKN
jgi:hypothetical protein